MALTEHARPNERTRGGLKHGALVALVRRLDEAFDDEEIRLDEPIADAELELPRKPLRALDGPGAERLHAKRGHRDGAARFRIFRRPLTGARARAAHGDRSA